MSHLCNGKLSMVWKFAAATKCRIVSSRENRVTQMLLNSDHAYSDAIMILGLTLGALNEHP